MMIFELSQLPVDMQKSLVQGEEVYIVSEGKAVGKFYQPSYANGDFDYDLDRMKAMMDCEFLVMPDFASDDEFLKWVNS